MSQVHSSPRYRLPKEYTYAILNPSQARPTRAYKEACLITGCTNPAREEDPTLRIERYDKVTWDEVESLTEKLTRSVRDEWGDGLAPTRLVGIQRGGVIVAYLMAYLMEARHLKTKVLAYPRTGPFPHTQSGRPLIQEDPPPEIAGERTLLVEDAVLTLRTVRLVKQKFLKTHATKRPSELKIASLVVNKLLPNDKPDFYGAFKERLVLLPWKSALKPKVKFDGIEPVARLALRCSPQAKEDLRNSIATCNSEVLSITPVAGEPGLLQVGNETVEMTLMIKEDGRSESEFRLDKALGENPGEGGQLYARTLAGAASMILRQIETCSLKKGRPVKFEIDTSRTGKHSLAFANATKSLLRRGTRHTD